MKFGRCCAAILGLIASAVSVQAQRAPVLRQIKVPHSYYYREMYLPQLTSGPSGAAWSPDGRELIYSMQGSLWRQSADSGVARQLTTGPGYDYQPDWSPDGRYVVYASYRNDAIELLLLDVTTGETRSLVANGAVNVEPRWDPGGRRIAFVSSAFEGRWHIFVVEVGADGKPGTPKRVTEDHNSGLPRYYYGAYDQYLSPTWSPDGKELIFISNRGHIWGSGGFWRMAAQPGSAPRELRYEETTWKARPDWSRDGKRVVYSSYLGRQWHQLWLMTSDGGDPLQLTYGKGDATSPRWSSDGKHIAFISNETGNTALKVVDIPGGRIRPVIATLRIYREPTARLRISVSDAASGRATAARVSIASPDGRNFAPDDAWRYADDSFDRRDRKFEYGYFHTAGTSVLTVPAGPLTVEVSRGPEYRVVRRRLEIAAGATSSVSVPLRRLTNLPASGWYSADLHVHMNYGGSYLNDPRHLAFQARAEDLHLVENLIVNKEGRVPDIGYFRGRPDPISTESVVIVHDQEYHTSYWGHSGLLGLRRNIVLPGYAGYANTPAASLYPTNAAVFDLAHEQGAVTGYVHPFDSDPDPADTTKPLTDEMPVDVALGKVDYYEALGFVDDYVATAKVWYRVLNCGFRLPAGAGTDAMANFASLRGPVGMNRVYAKSGTLTQSRWLAALKAGRTFATNGPLLEFSLGGKGLGEEVVLPAAGGALTARVALHSNVPVDHLEVIGNGEVVANIPLPGSRTSVTTTVPLNVRKSGWYLLRARGNDPAYPILDVYPYATTSPIYVTVGTQPIRSALDAEYFLAWIDRLKSGAERNTAWNSEWEKLQVLESIRQARTEFEHRRKD